jgi:hypothetical protein
MARMAALLKPSMNAGYQWDTYASKSAVYDSATGIFDAWSAKFGSEQALGWLKPNSLLAEAIAGASGNAASSGLMTMGSSMLSGYDSKKSFLANLRDAASSGKDAAAVSFLASMFGSVLKAIPKGTDSGYQGGSLELSNTIAELRRLAEEATHRLPNERVVLPAGGSHKVQLKNRTDKKEQEKHAAK